MKNPAIGLIFVLVVAAIAITIATNQTPADALSTTLLALMIGMLGFIWITRWGFKKGFRPDVQCVSCYRYRMLKSGENTLRCDNCGNLQADVPHLANRLQPARPA